MTLEKLRENKNDNKDVAEKFLHWHQIREVNLYLPDPNKSAKLFSKHKILTWERLRTMPHGLHLGFRRHW
jgi:hypothetical protein